MSELTELADALAQFERVGVVGYSIAIFGLLITGWLFTKGQVDAIKAQYEARIARLEQVLDGKYADEREASTTRRKR